MPDHTLDQSAPGVLVTRASERSSALVSSLNTAGFRAVELPCLAIRMLSTDTGGFKHQKLDTVIFTSYHAVDSMHKAQPFPWRDFTGQILAIGPATAQRLADLGQPVTCQPLHPYNSEALLRLDELTSGDNQSIAIVKGKGGRNYLQHALQERGFNVCTIDSYERILPEHQTSTIDAVFKPGVVDVITVTSNEVLHNLLQLAGSRNSKRLFDLPVITGSQRAAVLSRELGFSNTVIVADSPGDAALLSALQRWREV